MSHHKMGWVFNFIPWALHSAPLPRSLRSLCSWRRPWVFSPSLFPQGSAGKLFFVDGWIFHWEIIIFIGVFGCCFWKSLDFCWWLFQLSCVNLSRKKNIRWFKKIPYRRIRSLRQPAHWTAVSTSLNHASKKETTEPLECNILPITTSSFHPN